MVAMSKYPLYKASALDDLIRVIQERTTPDEFELLVTTYIGVNDYAEYLLNA